MAKNIFQWENPGKLIVEMCGEGKIEINKIKGTGHDFFWSGNPMNHFQKQGKIENW